MIAEGEKVLIRCAGFYRERSVLMVYPIPIQLYSCYTCYSPLQHFLSNLPDLSFSLPLHLRSWHRESIQIIITKLCYDARGRTIAVHSAPRAGADRVGTAKTSRSLPSARALATDDASFARPPSCTPSNDYYLASASINTNAGTVGAPDVTASTSTGRRTGGRARSRKVTRRPGKLPCYCTK